MTILWTELQTNDVETAKAFYTAVAGWTCTSMPMPGGEGEYYLFQSDGQNRAGLFDMAAVGMGHLPVQWVSYIDVPDVDAAVAAAVALAGTVLMPPMDVPTIGRTALLRDAQGALIGLMTPVENMQV